MLSNKKNTNEIHGMLYLTNHCISFYTNSTNLILNVCLIYLFQHRQKCIQYVL